MTTRCIFCQPLKSRANPKDWLGRRHVLAWWKRSALYFIGQLALYSCSEWLNGIGVLPLRSAQIDLWTCSMPRVMLTHQVYVLRGPGISITSLSVPVPHVQHMLPLLCSSFCPHLETVAAVYFVPVDVHLYHLHHQR